MFTDICILFSPKTGGGGGGGEGETSVFSSKDDSIFLNVTASLLISMLYQKELYES